MKRFFYLLLLFTGLTASQNTYACYAAFTHTNACASDTVWFQALDLFSIHAWDFGDTISGNPNISHDSITYHVYTQPGTYYVTHFNNIAAEWSYQTQMIVIGTNCFEAGFTAGCLTNANSLYFPNTSVGNNLTYLWNFGDPASGVLDTSSLQNGSHTYPVTPANYTVTLTISNGTQTHTATQIVSVGASCASVDIYDSYALPCIGDTITISSNANPTAYPVIIWNFGDPASGALNLATNVQSPTHVFNSTGLFIVSCIVSNGSVLDTAYTYVYVSDCRVWPGDANFDGKVSVEDILPIGIYYGATGTPRTNASANWVAQTATDWNSAGLPYMYLDDIINFKYADCNGDGQVNAADIAVIMNNFGNVSMNNNTTSFMIPHPADPEFSLNTIGATQTANTWVEVVANLGNTATPATGMYGFTTFVEYNPSLIVSDSVFADFSNSWMGNATDAITFCMN